MAMSKKGILMMLVFCYMLWGGGMVAMKYAFQSFDAMHVVFARVAFAGVFYLCLFPKWRRLPYRKGDWKYLLAAAAFEPCLFFLFETFSMKYTTASQGGVVAACFPVCTAVAAWMFLGEKLSKRVCFAIALAVAGVAGASYWAQGNETAPQPLLGNLLMFGAVLASTGYAVCVRHISQRYSFLSISAIQALGGSLLFTPTLFFVPAPRPVAMPALAGLLYMGLVIGIVVYLLFNFSLARLKAGMVALVGNLIPVFTLFFAYLFLGERMNLPQTLCVCLALTGVLIASSEEQDDADRKKKCAEPPSMRPFRRARERSGRG